LDGCGCGICYAAASTFSVGFSAFFTPSIFKIGVVIIVVTSAMTTSMVNNVGVNAILMKRS
jgi:hypothetical protein